MSNAISDMSAMQIYQQYIKPLSEEQRLKLLELTARDLANGKSQLSGRPTPMRSVLGLWQGTRVSPKDIDEARSELWGTFAAGDDK